MLTKEKVNEHIKSLSDEFTMNELMDHLELTERVERGLAESARGDVISKKT